MNRMMLCALMGCLTAFSTNMRAVADDSNLARPVVSPKQMMKDCMAKERRANPEASKEDMKKTCQAKIASYNQHPSETTPPPNNNP
jgi:hypothetical protein